MITPEFPKDEQERLIELQELEVLDTAPEERFDRYTRLARRLFDVPIALVSLVDADRQWFKSKQGLEACETGRDISFCGHAIHEEDVMVVENAAVDERFHDNPLVTEDPSIRFYAGYPLEGPGGHRIGTLCVIDRKARTLCEDDLETLRDIGEMVVNEFASLQMAITDELTGLSNRRGFETLSGQALAMCRRAGEPASLVMIDMDGFKQINDRFGHDEGDQALKAFAGLLLETFRDSDVVARIGGDEFCVLLTGAGSKITEIVTRRLRQAVEAHNAQSDKDYTLDCSIGIAEHDVYHHQGIAETMREADEQMYANKRSKPKRSRTAVH